MCSRSSIQPKPLPESDKAASLELNAIAACLDLFAVVGGSVEKAESSIPVQATSSNREERNRHPINLATALLVRRIIALRDGCACVCARALSKYGCVCRY